MRSKDLLNAMGKIDERLVDEALKTASTTAFEKEKLDADECYAEPVTEIKAMPKKRGIFKWAGLAAGLCIVAAGAIVLGQSQLFSRLVNSAAPSTDIDISFTAASDQTNDQPKNDMTESTEGVISVSPNPVPSENKTNILPNGLPDVPLAELNPSNEFFLAESLPYTGYLDKAAPAFISDGRIFCTKYSESSDDSVTRLSILCYESGKEETREIFTEEFFAEKYVSYEFLCVYGDYIYLYRSETPFIAYAKSPDEYPYTDIAEYTLCRASLTDRGALQELATVTLELLPHFSDCVIIGNYMYFEEIVGTDDDAKSHIYRISVLDLTDGSIYDESFKNARCPLLYQNKLVFYRDGAFWQCELDGSDEQVLFYDTAINFFKDRLCSDGNNIVLARSYTELKDDLNQYSAFTIEVYDGQSGFVPAALFTSDVTSPEYFINIRSAPVISCADGLFGFLDDIIFDPETDTFVKMTPAEDDAITPIIVMINTDDDQIYYCVYNIDWSEEQPFPITDSRYYLLKKKNQQIENELQSAEKKDKN